MALIVEDGTGLANAEAYISAVNAQAYVTLRGYATAWAALVDPEVALRLAADFMRQRYRTRWAGWRNSGTQALDWPRTFVPIPDAPSGWASFRAYYANNVVPNEVQWANALLALKTANGELMPDLTQQVTKQTVGPISVEYDPTSRELPRYSAIDALLGPLLESSGNMVKLGRA